MIHFFLDYPRDVSRKRKKTMPESNVLANIITGILGKKTDNVGCPWFKTV